MGVAELRANAERQMFYEQERHGWSVNLNTTLRALEEWNTSEETAASAAEAHELMALKDERTQSQPAAAL